MDATLRTLPLPGAVQPVREHGASALDRPVVAWPAPEASARVLDRWGMPPLASGALPWPAPDPVMRFDLPAPDLRRVASDNGSVPWADLIEPRYRVTAPDLHSVSRVALAPPSESSPVEFRTSNDWPPPTPHTATAPDAAASTAPDAGRSRLSTRAVVGLATAAGALAAGAAVLVALF